jgi:hypothetical protein
VSQTPSKLERHARALLRAYPAEYRHGRAEEIIGTLLEAAPPGRSFPPAREAWSLIAGGRHARAARNRRLGVKANVRLALLLGISTYFMGYRFGLILAGNALGFLPGDGASWLTNTALALGAAAALAPWLGSRAATTALAIPAGTLLAYAELRGHHGSLVTVSLAEDLIVMAALAALSGGPVRLPRSWLWLPCAFPLTLAAGRLLSPQHVRGPVSASHLELDAQLLLAVVVVCWLVTDARPAFACLAMLLEEVTSVLPYVVYDKSLMIQNLGLWVLGQFAIVLPILLPAAWLLLRRQKAPSPRPFPEP